MEPPIVLLFDNGSVRAASTLNLRSVADRLATLTGRPVEAVSLLHSTNVSPEDLGGTPARLLEPTLRSLGAAGTTQVTLLPFFLGPSLALSAYLPQRLAAVTQAHTRLRIAIAGPLVSGPCPGPDADALATILAERVIESATSLATQVHHRPPTVALVDHGSPEPRVTAVRNVVASALARKLGTTVANVVACSMERRPGDEFAFNDPLLADVLGRHDPSHGPVIVALLFLSPGRHAGPDGDIAGICAAASAARPGLVTVMTRLVGTHTGIIDILARRLSTTPPPPAPDALTTPLPASTDTRILLDLDLPAHPPPDAPDLVRATTSGSPEPLIRVRFRPAPATDNPHDRAQGYTGPLALEVCWRTPPPIARIAALARDHARRHGTAGPPFSPPPDLATGTQRIGVNWPPLDHPADGSPIRVRIALGGAHAWMSVDGRLEDEEWPAEPLLIPAETAIAFAPDGPRFAETTTPPPAPPEHLPPFGPCWTPASPNAWAGDAMLVAHGDHLHLHWLADRRRGLSKFGCGAHRFFHLSTRDLRSWTHHPPSFPITRLWEPTAGTGCVVVDDAGRHHAFANIITSRLGLESTHPEGTWRAIAPDAIRFAKSGFTGLPGEPGIVRDAGGTWHAVSASRHADGTWRTARYTSPDLARWSLADPEFLPPPGWPPTRDTWSSECFCWFGWRGTWYILGGRTGFWRATSLLGPYHKSGSSSGPRVDPYDGLMVPQAAVWQDRCILAGWLALHPGDFAGHLVLRELHVRGDGELSLTRIAAMEPTLHAWLATPHPGTAAGPLPGRLRLRITPDRQQPVSILLSSAPSPGSPIAELRLDAASRTAAWLTPGRTSPLDPAADQASFGRDFAIHEVDGLEGTFDVDLILWPDAKSSTLILDASLSVGRTLITRRDGTAGAGSAAVTGASNVAILPPL